ncbi:MAG: AmmeMemoRadiSam system radical SAM enzyme [Bacteroidetes bacterium]|nr:AmmeMemoRadiSam system radical SAM enzyme [Bacteroidota bacterium]
MTTAAIRCEFCFHQCLIGEGKTGICGVRKTRDGRVLTTVYGEVVSAGVDPIEKKPFYHVKPGSSTLSVALPGCNFRCLFCQNYAISQYNHSRYGYSGKKKDLTSPQKLVELLLDSNLEIMTYTYSDPVVWQDYMLDTARLVREIEQGLNCMVTNGSMTANSLIGMLDYIDAFNIDVKGDEDFYRTYCNGNLAPVLDNLERINTDGRAVVEVTTLVIEGIHFQDDIYRLGSRLRDAGVQVWHLSRFFPAYKMLDRQETSEAFLHDMLQTASESGIPFIYSGNSRERLFISTHCPECRAELIPTHSYGGEAGNSAGKHILDGKCCECGNPVYGLF